MCSLIVVAYPAAQLYWGPRLLFSEVLDQPPSDGGGSASGVWKPSSLAPILRLKVSSIRVSDMPTVFFSSLIGLLFLSSDVTIP